MTEYIDIDVRRIYKQREDGKYYLADEVLLEEGVVEPPDPPDPPPSGDIPYSQGKATIILKNAGSSDHPSGHEYEAYYTKVGRKVNLDIRYYFKASGDPPKADLGSGGDEFWIDVEGPEEIVPDFEVEGCLESVGDFHLYHEPGPIMRVGSVYWSKNVGSGKDGLRMVYDGKHISKDYPVAWNASSHWRISIAYTV